MLSKKLKRELTAHRLDDGTTVPLTPEQAKMEAEFMEQMEEGYQVYARLVAAYETVIELEDCPLRKEQLRNILGHVHEDNK